MFGRSAGLGGKKCLLKANRSFGATNRSILDRSRWTRYIIGGTTTAALWVGAIYCQDNPAIPQAFRQSSFAVALIGTGLCLVYSRYGWAALTQSMRRVATRVISIGVSFSQSVCSICKNSANFYFWRI